MSQADKALRFAALHQPGDPVILYNIWDAGGARAVASAGAAAVATGSWAMGAAHGYDDGEAIPLDLVVTLVERICASVDVPVTVDFEGAYAVDPSQAAENTRRILRAGAVGINLEDRVVQGEGLHATATQAARITAIKAVAAQEGMPLFVNARTDLFLGTAPDSHAGRMGQAQERQAAYAEAGADCLFVPGLTDTGLIVRMVEQAQIPVNIMMTGPLRSVAEVAALGVARVSFGPAPYLRVTSDIEARFAEIRERFSTERVKPAPRV